MKLDYVPTVCPYCGCGCGMYLVVRDDKIVGVEPRKDHPVNEGKNCPKGRNSFDFLYADGRLDKPLVRKNGSLKEATWDEALQMVARGLKEADAGSVAVPDEKPAQWTSTLPTSGRTTHPVTLSLHREVQ